MNNKDEKETIHKNEDVNTDNEKEINSKQDSNNETDQSKNLSDDPAILDDENNHEEEEQSSEEGLQDQIDLLRDEKLRLLAEMENFRKRADRDKVDSLRYGSMNLARDVLSPGDNLARALEAIPQQEEKSETVDNLIDGLKMVQKEFTNILEKHGVKKIDALNSKFDHNLHQAMVEIENDDVDEGMVIQEMQSGYTMHDRLLRPSMVGVSKKNTINTSDQKKEDDKN